MAGELRTAAQELLEATEALARAVEQPEPRVLAAALERRRACFVAVRRCPGPPDEARDLLRRAADLDREILDAARAAQEGVRGELEALTRARRAARALRAQSPREGPRFVTRRV